MIRLTVRKFAEIGRHETTCKDAKGLFIPLVACCNECIGAFVVAYRHLGASSFFVSSLSELRIDLVKETFGIPEEFVGHVQPELSLLGCVTIKVGHNAIQH